MEVVDIVFITMGSAALWILLEILHLLKEIKKEVQRCLRLKTRTWMTR